MPQSGEGLNPYAQYLPVLLPIVGVALQWLRQFSGVGERWTFAAAILGASGVYALCLDWSAQQAVQQGIIDFLIWMASAVPSVLGGTFAASKAASAGLAVIPTTNSR